MHQLSARGVYRRLLRRADAFGAVNNNTAWRDYVRNEYRQRLAIGDEKQRTELDRTARETLTLLESIHDLHVSLCANDVCGCVLIHITFRNCW